MVWPEKSGYVVKVPPMVMAQGLDMAGAAFPQRQSQGELVGETGRRMDLCTIRLGAQFSIYLGKEQG